MTEVAQEEIHWCIQSRLSHYDANNVKVPPEEPSQKQKKEDTVEFWTDLDAYKNEVSHF